MPNRDVHMQVGAVSGTLTRSTTLGVSPVLIYWQRQQGDWSAGLGEGCFPTGLTRPVLRAIAPKRTA
jgi:hypothetical protein